MNKNSLKLRGATALSGERYVAFTYPEREHAWLPLDECFVPMASLFEKLAAAGLRIAGKDFYEHVRDELVDTTVFPEEPIVGRPGWVRSSFITPDGQVFTPKGEQPPFCAFAKTRPLVEICGKYKSWRKGVADPLTGQHMPMFVIMLAFATALRDVISDAPNLNFELVGPQSTGKTTLQLIAASALGSAGPVPLPFAQLLPSVSDQVDGHTGSLMLIDTPEPALAGDTPAKRAANVLATIAQLNNRCSNQTGSDRGRPTSTASYLITGRVPLVDTVAPAVGAVVADRQITLKVDPASPFGFFDTLPTGYVSSSQFAADLRTTATKLYGNARTRFYLKLVQARADGEKGLRSKIERRMAWFRTEAGVDPNDGAMVELANVFGFVLAAGHFAQFLDVLPSMWDCSAAVLACFKKHRVGPVVMDHILNRLEAIADGDDVFELGPDVAANTAEISNAKVFLRCRKRGRELMIRPCALETLLPDWRTLQHQPDVKKLLITDAGHLTVKRRLHKAMPQSRVHVFSLAAWPSN